MNREYFIVKSSGDPTVEIDSSALSAYVRFTSKKVAKTVSVESDRAAVTVDLDERGEVVGVELVGVREFGIRQLLMHAPRLTAPRIAYSRAKYVAAGTPQLAPA